MRKTRIKKLVKRDWIARTFDKKYAPYIWWFDLWKKGYYKNNEDDTD